MYTLNESTYTCPTSMLKWTYPPNTSNNHLVHLVKDGW